MSSKITALTALTSVQADDVLPVADVHDTTQASSGTTKKIAVSDLQAGLLKASSNLSDLGNAGTARTNLGLGTAATQASSAFDTAGVAATETTRALAAEALLAPLASPALTGNPTASTQTALNNSTRVATTAYADSAVGVETTRATTAEALALPKAGGTMSGAIAMGTSKITGVGNGSGAQDVAAFGQLPVLAAADTSAVVGGTATAPTVRTGTLDVVAAQHPAAADWSNNSHKITSVANGSGAQDVAAFGQVPVVEGTIGNIKPVSTAAVLGSSGKWPDSDHVHLGFFGGIFGTAADGAVTLDGSTTYNGFSSLAGSTYTLTRDVMAASLTINNGVTLKTVGYRIFCQGTFTNNGTLSCVGLNGVGGTAGGSSNSGAFLGGRAGGAGGTGVSGTGGNGTNASYGATGGAGGAGTSGAAGSGGTATQSVTVAQNNILPLPYPAISGIAGYAGSNLQLGFGAGGGGGGSDASSNAGGGGGGGGGIVAIFAWAAVNNTTITVAGGNGGTAAAGNAGGGGGGAGGAILVYTLAAWTAGTATVSGGSLGSGHGTGSNGNAGGNGLLLNTVLA